MSYEECCFAMCSAWGGTCPDGFERRDDDDGHQCTDDSCDEEECCHRYCSEP